MKLWSGRFTKNTSHMMDDFHSSIGFDQRLYREDIEGSLAHAAMLKKQGIISASDEAAIHEGLLTILKDMEEGKRREKKTRQSEDSFSLRLWKHNDQ